MAFILPHDAIHTLERIHFNSRTARLPTSEAVAFLGVRRLSTGAHKAGIVPFDEIAAGGRGRI